ncbi:hypothetical protein [Sphingomonas sp. 10B4]|uniref:hypothetical protein n=1 Tax=Sphingomonas sp. 10B4 TaxID=3048575 RepID=UPI002B227AE6|nr:hypothetical protein [Sphingomonas sp. 10B4]
MFYDVSYRFSAALCPDALTGFAAALHAVNAAVADCERAGRPVAADPAIHLLIRHLASVSVGLFPDTSEMQDRCAAAIFEITERPALALLAGHDLGDRPDAKRTFHFQSRRALVRLCDQLGFDAGACRIGTDLGRPSSSGETSLRCDDLYLLVTPKSFESGREIMFHRCIDGRDAGRFHHAPLNELLDPPVLAARVRHVLGRGATISRLAA